MADSRRYRRNYKEVPENVEENIENIQEEAPVEAETESVEISEETKADSIPSECKVNVPRLNLRQKPDTESLILNVLNQDDNLKIISETPDFYEVYTADDEVGYVVKKYVTI